jgi:hypothetical protein
VLDNSGTRQQLEAQLDAVWEDLVAMASAAANAAATEENVAKR